MNAIIVDYEHLQKLNLIVNKNHLDKQEEAKLLVNYFEHKNDYRIVVLVDKKIRTFVLIVVVVVTVVNKVDNFAATDFSDFVKK